MSQTSLLLGVCVLATACQSTTDDESAIAANPLGIVRIQVEHHVQGGDKLLEVQGFSESGDVIGNATLRTGMVHYSEEPDVAPEVWTPGTELTITVENESHIDTSPDRLPHEIPEPSQLKVAAFTRLAAVAAAIDKEAGIRFARPHADGEVAFSVGTCPSSFFPSTASQCCRNGDFMYLKATSDNKLWVRAINSQGGAPCRNITSQTGCSVEGTACWFGPCGVHSDIAASPNTTSAAVFFPTSDPTQCGRDSNGTATGGGVEVPEAYNGAQIAYSGVTNGCPYSACKSDGTPGTALTLDAECVFSSGGLAGGGSITWNGNTVTCDYATHPSVSHTYYFPYNTSGTITSSGGQWWAGWNGGACSGASTSCTHTFTNAATVTGTFNKDTCPTC